MKAERRRLWWRRTGDRVPRVLLLAALVIPVAGLSEAQTLTGTIFEDRDGDGIVDPGEPVLAGVMVDLSGTPAGGTPFAQIIVTGADGLFSFSPGQGATLTTNPTLPPGAAGYDWPALDHFDLATTAIRVASFPVGATPGNDAYQVELDHAWLDLYGWVRPRPTEVQGLRVDRLADGRLVVSFDAAPEALRYNLYVGSLQALRTGGYDHGAGPSGPFCATTTEDPGGGRLEIVLDELEQPPIDAYVLVTLHDSQNIESPAGFDSLVIEIDRSHSVCR